MGRALAVVEYMQKAGIPGYRLIASGRGQYEPLFPNDTPQHRTMNSRVEIIIVYKVEQDVLNLQGMPAVK
jgi:chemotaxis protein MotB